MRNSFIHPEKVSIKTWTYLHLPLASQILGKSVSKHLPRYWPLTWTPFWLKALCFEFIWAKTWHLAEKSCTRFSKVGIIYLDMSNEEIILDPRYIAWWKSVTRVLPFFFYPGRIIFPSDVLYSPMASSCWFFPFSFSFFPWLYHRVSSSSGIWYVTKISIILLVLGPLSELQGQWPGYILPEGSRHFGVLDSRS